jgi:hypothetical protein
VGKREEKKGAGEWKGKSNTADVLTLEQEKEKEKFSFRRVAAECKSDALRQKRITKSLRLKSQAK